MSWWSWTPVLEIRENLGKQWKAKQNKKGAFIWENCRGGIIIKRQPNFYLRQDGEGNSWGHLGKTWVEGKEVEDWVRLRYTLHWNICWNSSGWFGEPRASSSDFGKQNSEL